MSTDFDNTSFPWIYHRGQQIHPSPGRAAMKERYNQLAGLDADRVKQLYEAWRKGDYADLQIAFAELEEYDDILSSVADKRDAAIGEATYSVRPIAAMIGDNAALAAQAEEQQAWLTRKLVTILNLKEAIRWLGTASFRGYAHLYIEQSGGNVRLQPVPQWYFADPAGEGVFYLNPTAAAGAGDLYELPPGQYIVRTVKRPVDIIALGACVIKYNGEQGWQSFLDIFGNPAIFFEYPPGTSDERAREYDAMAKALIGDGRGGFPSGGKFTTIDTQAKGGESFQQITDWANKKIVRKALAGELTLLAESGTGTLAGGAHAEGFKSLATGDCRSIAECIQSQYLDRLLDRKFPGMPHLVEFILEYPETRDLSIETAAIATLAGAGFVTDAEQVAERTGYNCTYQQPQQGMPNGMPAMLTNRAPGNAGGVEEAPLTAAELEAFRSLAKPNKARMEQRQKEVETALRRAADLPEAKKKEDNKAYSDAVARAVGYSGIGIEEIEKNKRDGGKGGLVANIKRIWGGVISIFNGGPGGKDCEAKSVKTCKCLVNDKPPAQIFPKDWAKTIGDGLKAQTPLGDKVTLNKDIEEDWAQKPQREKDWRKRNLLYAMETLRNPQEIWQGYKGNKIHISKFGEDETGKHPARALIVVTHGSRVVTYYAEKKQIAKMDKYRKGKLLYKRKRTNA